MVAPIELKYVIQNQIELNFSFMPFIKGGGIFVPVNDRFSLDDLVNIELHLPGHTESIHIEGRVVWTTPRNALYQVYSGVGVQFIGDNARKNVELIKSNLDNTSEVGGYAYGMSTSQ